MIERREPRLPPTPSAVLRSLLDDTQTTQDQLAEALGVSRFTVNQIANDRRAITSEMALRLARAFDTTPEFWLNLQRQVDLAKAGRRLGDKLDEVKRIRRAISDDDLFYDATG